jgi:hypothetical protein
MNNFLENAITKVISKGIYTVETGTNFIGKAGEEYIVVHFKDDLRVVEFTYKSIELAVRKFLELTSYERISRTEEEVDTDTPGPLDGQ